RAARGASSSTTASSRASWRRSTAAWPSTSPTSASCSFRPIATSTRSPRTSSATSSASAARPEPVSVDDREAELAALVASQHDERQLARDRQPCPHRVRVLGALDVVPVHLDDGVARREVDAREELLVAQLHQPEAHEAPLAQVGLGADALQEPAEA